MLTLWNGNFNSITRPQCRVINYERERRNNTSHSGKVPTLTLFSSGQALKNCHRRRRGQFRPRRPISIVSWRSAHCNKQRKNGTKVDKSEVQYLIQGDHQRRLCSWLGREPRALLMVRTYVHHLHSITLQRAAVQRALSFITIIISPVSHSTTQAVHGGGGFRLRASAAVSLERRFS